jgi:hypothetical protein
MIGANDEVNTAARSNKSSPIFGMPILNADKVTQVYVVKHGEGNGYVGIVNALFYGDDCNEVWGDAQTVLVKTIEAVHGLGSAAASPDPSWGGRHRRRPSSSRRKDPPIAPPQRACVSTSSASGLPRDWFSARRDAIQAMDVAKVKIDGDCVLS